MGACEAASLSRYLDGLNHPSVAAASGSAGVPTDLGAGGAGP